ALTNQAVLQDDSVDNGPLQRPTAEVTAQDELDEHPVSRLAPALQFAVEIWHGFEEWAEQFLQRVRPSGGRSDGLNQHSVGVHTRPEMPEEAVCVARSELPARREEFDERRGRSLGCAGHCATANPSCACIETASR